MIKLSVVLPTYNESALGFLPAILGVFEDIDGVELIAVDGGSGDGTLDLLQKSSCRIIHRQNSSRAERLNTGIQASSGEMLLLHHPRSVLTADGIRNLLALSEQKIWGGFTHRFDTDHWLLKFTSWYSNRVRWTRGIVYLDHCIFFHRSFRGQIPDVAIFEDTELSYQLKRQFGHPRQLTQVSTTSAVRFIKNGIFRQALMNQLLKISYHFKLPRQAMNRKYERNLNLNNDVGE